VAFTYTNGRIPKDRLITFATGVNTTVGYWEHSLSPATYARHLALVKRARDRTGRTLAMGAGWSAYRPFDQQVIARKIYGNGAANPGTSSHGGFWEGRQTLAMDYSNWGYVYNWDQGAFFADCRAVGLTPGMIMRSRGYPDEPWHVIDLNPWGAVPAFDGVFTPFPSEEDDMFTEQDRNRLNATVAALYGNRNVTGGPDPLRWVNIDGDAQAANYGLLPIEINTQVLVAKQSGQIAALVQLVQQIGTGDGSIDIAAIERAAERGAREALADLTITVNTGDTAA